MSRQRAGFDFLIGKRWKVKNTLLKERLAGCQEWTSFEAVLDDGRKIAGGLGNVDSFQGVRDGKAFEGNSLRLYDQESDSWVIYWVDSIRGKLEEQVRGRFEGGRGEFFGEVMHGSKRVRVRFLWTEIRNDHAKWEQAYWDDEAGAWETNWVMDFQLDQ